MKLYIFDLKRSIKNFPCTTSTILVFSTCKKILAFNYSISTSKIHLAEVPSLNSNHPCMAWAFGSKAVKYGDEIKFKKL